MLNHNRSGLLLALQSLQLPQGSRVGVMAYNCHTVMNAVDRAGYKIVFVDITMGLKMDVEDLRKKKERLSALIVSHLFGLANDIEIIKSVCPDIPIIEDCAHTYAMDSCGRMGDFAVYSIGVGKFPSVGDGGVLRVNNPGYRNVVGHLYAKLPKYSKKEERQLMLKLIAMQWLYSPWVYSFVTLPLLKHNKNRSIPSEKKTSVLKMSDGIAAVYCTILQEIEKQKKLNQSVAESLTGYFSKRKEIRLINTDLRNSNCFMFPVYCESPELLKKEFRNMGIETETHFHNCIIWCKSYGYRDGECPTAEHLLKHLLMIPTYKKLKL